MEPSRILVVDDSLTIRRALEFILKPKGYALEFAADGREALDRGASFQPDLVLLDYVLPDMRGPDVCSALAAIPVTSQTPVILVSAKGASIRQAYQDAHNVVSYVTKPFKPQVVLSVVENALSRARPAAPVATAPTPAPTVTPEAPPSPVVALPEMRAATLEETFSALLGQLEDVVSAETRREIPQTRTLARLGAPLRRAREQLREIGQHLADEGVAPYRIRSDGSFANVASTLLETHRLLCEATVALAAAGAPGPELPAAPDVVVAVPREDHLHDALDRIAGRRDDVLLLDREFAALPWVIHLMQPQLLVAVPEATEELDQALTRVASDGLRRIAVLPAGGSIDDRRLPGFERMSDLDDVAAAMGGADATSSLDEIGLEIVSL